MVHARFSTSKGKPTPVTNVENQTGLFLSLQLKIKVNSVASMCNQSLYSEFLFFTNKYTFY